MSAMSALTGTPSLVRLALRTDRIRLTVWVLALVGITGASARAVASTYDTPAEIASYSRNLGSSPATVAMSGPPFALDQIGGIVVFETSLTVLVGVALMAALTVVRHTRADEEAGRTELLASTVVGRHADTAAALLVASGASVLVGLGVALSVLGGRFPGPGGRTVRRLSCRDRPLLRGRRDRRGAAHVPVACRDRDDAGRVGGRVRVARDR